MSIGNIAIYPRNIYRSTKHSTASPNMVPSADMPGWAQLPLRDCSLRRLQGYTTFDNRLTLWRLPGTSPAIINTFFLRREQPPLAVFVPVTLRPSSHCRIVDRFTVSPVCKTHARSVDQTCRERSRTAHVLYIKQAAYQLHSSVATLARAQ